MHKKLRCDDIWRRSRDDDEREEEGWAERCSHLIVNNDDICSTRVLPRLNSTVEILAPGGAETRKLIKDPLTRRVEKV